MDDQYINRALPIPSPAGVQFLRASEVLVLKALLDGKAYCASDISRRILTYQNKQCLRSECRNATKVLVSLGLLKYESWKHVRVVSVQKATVVLAFLTIINNYGCSRCERTAIKYALMIWAVAKHAWVPVSLVHKTMTHNEATVFARSAKVSRFITYRKGADNKQECKLTEHTLIRLRVLKYVTSLFTSH